MPCAVIRAYKEVVEEAKEAFNDDQSFEIVASCRL